MNCKKLSNKGFSLVEILVAVSIIGIISAIAIPAFQDYREQASKVAGDTSIGNVGRAYQNCMVLKQFTQCFDLGKLGITCPDCNSSHNNPTGTKFCAGIDKKIGGEQFRACVSYDGNDFVKRSYGGSLLKDVKICKDKMSNCSVATDNKTVSQAGAKECTAPSDCTAGTLTCSGTGGTTSAVCEAVGTTGGTCASGVCS